MQPKNKLKMIFTLEKSYSNSKMEMIKQNVKNLRTWEQNHKFIFIYKEKLKNQQRLSNDFSFDKQDKGAR